MIRLKENRIDGLLREGNMNVGSWMDSNPEYVLESNLELAVQKMIKQDLTCLPIVSKEKRPIGLMTQKMILEYLLQKADEKSLKNKIIENNPVVYQDDSLWEAASQGESCYSVVNKDNVLVGVITSQEITKGISSSASTFKKNEHTDNVLKVILESAYEGIVVVDQHGIIKEFNKAYSKFTGIPVEKAIGRHVRDVIDNTNLYNTVKTGLPERGVIQTIQGQPMIVHRIPIWKGNKLAGAIGMLIFKGVSEVYNIFERLQELNLQQPSKITKPRASSSKNNPITLDRIIGESEEISNLKRLARKVAQTNTTLLITGESGTGKELFAKGIHQAGSQSNGPFVSLNCGAIPEALFESELFGYEEGAFTGAKKGGKPGKFTLAQDGTLFLDEIGEMPLMMQTKLLRALQEKEVERIGGVEKVEFNARIIAATNRDLREMVRNGEFREDLYYRINVIELSVSPLRERKEDIPLLVAHYLKEICARHNFQLKTLTSEVMLLLINHPWPGNIRELVNMLEKLVVLTEEDTITLSDIPLELFQIESIHRIERQENPAMIRHAKEIGDIKEKEIIQQALERASGNKTLAASYLGIHRTTLYQKLKKYQL